jgi:hypothetical protein
MDAAIVHLERIEARLKQRLEQVSGRLAELHARRAQRGEQRPTQQGACTTSEQVTWL